MLSQIDLTSLDRRALHMPFTPQRRVSLPVRGRAPTEAEMARGMGAAQSANPYPQGQCTWAVWEQVHELGVDMPDFPGNATDWGQGMDAQGYQKMAGPTVNSITVWSSSKYPPYGHVAFVTKVMGADSQGGVAFQVREMNFYGFAQWDDRVVQAGNQQCDQCGLEGFWVPTGISPGQGAPAGLLSAATDPWSELTGGLNELERGIQQQAQTLAEKVFAAATIGAGMGMMGGGALLTGWAIRSPQSANAALARLPQRVRGVSERRVVPAAQDVVLGPEPQIAGGTMPGRVTAAGKTRVLAR